jgi:hypothetical protein
MSTATASKWVEAGGEFQIPFMLAARKVTAGDPVPCPRCRASALRYYFHVMNRQQGTGTLWEWCPSCFTKCHLPRVSPAVVGQVDPFAALTIDQFSELELDPRERFMDRLNRLWDEGKLT